MGLSNLRALRAGVWLPATLAIVLSWTATAGAAPTLGFVENWPGISTTSWGGGTLLSNPGSGGVSGPGDGFLLMDNGPFPAQLGARSDGPEYAGNWSAAGITQVRLWLNDVNAPDALEIHFSLGRAPLFPDPGNFWQYNVGFIPPPRQWEEFVVDLSSPMNWTQIIGTGSFADALTSVTRIHVRHDQAPFIKSPDFAAGDVGMDHLLLTNGLVSVEPERRVAVGRPVELAPPAPNPSRGPVAFALESFESGPVHLQVVDAGGRLVRQAELPDGNAGARLWNWDGTDDHGHRVAPGYYRIRAWGASGGTSRPFIRVR